MNDPHPIVLKLLLPTHSCQQSCIVELAGNKEKPIAPSIYSEDNLCHV